MAGGRPSKYKPEFNEIAYKAARNFKATNRQLADLFSVTTSTIDKWIAEIPEFSGALKRGKDEVDSKVEAALVERAMGYSHEAVKIFCHNGMVTEVPYTEKFPPDTVACIFWLKNRRPDLWRDKQDMEVTGKGGAEIVPIIQIYGKS